MVGQGQEKLRQQSPCYKALHGPLGGRNYYSPSFLEVCFSDTTMGTNAKKRPLFILAGKDSGNKSFTALWALMPSQCMWVFQWLWDVAIPCLLGREATKRVNGLITDGDWNKYSPFTDAVRKGFYNSNAVHQLCVYHLLLQPLQALAKYVPDNPDAKKQYKEFVSWCFSFTTDIETEEEFTMSKAGLRAWLRREETVTHLGINAIEKLEEWLVMKVFTKETRFARCYFLGVWNFENKATSVVESINLSAKNSSKGLHASFLLDKTVSNLNMHLEMLCRDKERDVILSLSLVPTWSQKQDFAFPYTFCRGADHERME